MANSTSEALVSIRFDAKDAVEHIEVLRKKINEVNKEWKKMADGPDKEEMGEYLNSLRKMVKDADDEIKRQMEAYDVAGKSVNQLNGALREANRIWKALRDETDRNKMAEKISLIRTEIDRLTSATKPAKEAIEKLKPEAFTVQRGGQSVTVNEKNAVAYQQELNQEKERYLNLGRELTAQEKLNLEQVQQYVQVAVNGQNAINASLGEEFQSLDNLQKAQAALAEQRRAATTEEDFKKYSEQYDIVTEKIKGLTATAKEAQEAVLEIQRGGKNVTVNGKNAVAFIPQMKAEVVKLKEEMNKLGTSRDNATDKRKWDQLQKKVDAFEKKIEEAEDDLEDIAHVASGKTFNSLDKLEKVAAQLKEKLRYADNAAEANKLRTQLAAVQNQMQKLTNETDKSNHAFGKLAQRAAEYTGMYMLFNRSRQLIQNAIQGNLALSDSISDIQKVSGLSEEAVKGLVTQIEKIDSRNAPETLNQMAYAAGKLGIKGAENLLGFTRAADKLNVALKEYLGDGAEGVVKLMKFANVMGTTDQYGVEQALIKTGSVLNYMTQSTAAAADYMIEFASRFGPIARQARMTTGDVVGLASALDALSVNNEEAATSLQKFVVRLLSAPTATSKALGINSELAKQMVETGKSIELVEMALAKLGERAEKYGVSGIQSIIGDIGSKGQAQRLIKTLATLSNNTQMVHDYIIMANQAFEEGTSIIDEYNIKNQNAAAIMERMKNAWEKTLVNSENVGLVKELAQELYDMTMELQQSEMWTTSMTNALGLLFKAFKALVWLLPSVIAALAGLGISKLVVGIISAGRALVAFALSLKNATLAWKTFDLAMKTNVIGLVAAAVTLLVSGIWRYVEAQNEATRKAEEFKKKIQDLTSNMEDYNKELYKEQRAMDQLFAKAKAANGETDEKKRLISEINVKYGKYLQHLLDEKSSVEDIAAAQKEANKQLRESIALKIKEGKLTEIRETFAEKGATGLESFRSGVEKTGLGTEDIVKAQKQIQELLSKNYGKSGYGGPNQATVTILRELAKTDDRWNFVINGRGQMPSVYDWKREQKKQGRDYYGSDPISTGRREAAYNKEKELREGNRKAYEGIFNYVSSVIELTNAERKLNEKYDPLIGDLLNKKEPEEENKNTEVLEDFSKEQAAAERERLKLEREMMKQTEQELAGVGSMIEAFYNKRDAAINELYENGGITGMQRDRMREENKVDKAWAQNAAWRLMLGEDGSEELWKEQLGVMKTQVMNDSQAFGEEMQQLWTDIGQKDLLKVGELLQRFGSKMTGGMQKTISVNQKLIEQSGAKVLENVRKDMERYDYAEQVKTKFLGVLQQMFLFRTKWEDGFTEGFDDAQQAAKAGMTELANMYDQLFDLETEENGDLTEKGLEQFKAMLLQAKYLSEDMAKMTKEELQVLFYQTVKLGEETTAALKKQVDRQKKIIDERWKRDPRNLNNEKAQNDVKQTGGLAGTIAGKWGIQSNVETKDVEIELYALKLQAATDYYNKLKEEKADQRLLDEQEIKIMEAQMSLQEKLAERINVLQQFFVDSMNTLPEFGTALGEAFAQTDPEERAEAFNNALKDMVSSLGEATKKMILEWIKQRIQHSIQQSLMAKDEQASEAQRLSNTVTAETAIANAKAAIGQTALVTQQTQNAESLTNDAATTTGEVNLGIASGAAKTIGKLGWWGIPLVAVITALLNGLLSWALGSLFKGKESSSSSSSAKNNLRLVKGMLTYDEGNVQTFQQAKEGGAYTVLGNDGRVYSAHKQSELPTGIVRRPTATLVNGQPSLVAEKGPEMIVGRKTLRAMTQFRPDLVQQIIKFDRNRRHGFRTYDEGNLDELALQTSNLQPQTSNQADLLAALQESKAVNEQTAMAVGALVAELRRGIGVRKYGTGGLVEEVIDGLYTTKKKNTSPMLRRLLGT